MPRGKEPILSVLFQGRTIPIRNSSDLEIIQKFVSLVGEPKKAVRGVGKRGKRMNKAVRVKKALAMKEKGMTVKQIAEKIGASTMTITRDLKEGKKE